MTGAPLTLYNSLTRSLERFVPLDPGNVRVYSCGPTVYNYAHIGNLRAYVFTDTLSRVLRWKGYPLTHIINITDVGHLTSDADAGDDKMGAAARAQAISIWDVAAHYTSAFRRNLRDLNTRDADRFPLATDHVDDMIAFAEKIAADHCYELASGLYFDTATVPDYGRLAGTREDDREGRIDPVADKRHPQDFAIWRKSAPGENRQMEWDSPWGRGAPGWHLECSVMSRKYLGENFDIHTGGIDHREIHHPNEIAQNQAYCGCPETPGYTGATFWMHNNFLVERTGKMSKSRGGFTTLQTLIDAGFHPLAYRMMCLQAHYRSELEFSWDNLAAASRRLQRIVLAVRRLKPDSTIVSQLRKEFPQTAPAKADAIAQHRAAGSVMLKRYLDRFDTAVSADLATPEALLALEEMLKNKSLSKRERARGIAIMDEVFGLGLLRLTRRSLRVTKLASKAPVPLIRADIDAFIRVRRLLKGAGQMALVDELRTLLGEWGIEVMDGDPLGWDWKIDR